MDKKQLVLGIASLIFILISLYLSFSFQAEVEECLEKSELYIEGEVDEIIHYKGKNVKIYFTVDGNHYTANDKAYDASDPVHIGDRFYIHYCKDDPSLNRILFDRRVSK
ncbi:MAG: hypothetical protein AAGC85_13620 [Bacteroidota bacterium]